MFLKVGFILPVKTEGFRLTGSAAGLRDLSRALLTTPLEPLRQTCLGKNGGSGPLLYMLQLPSAGAMTGIYLPMSQSPGAAVDRLACSNM